MPPQTIIGSTLQNQIPSQVELHNSLITEKPVSSFIRAYAANSHRGIIKPFNEDRLSIVPKLAPNYEEVSIFAVYDGHGGSGCADYLKENIPRFILKQD